MFDIPIVLFIFKRKQSLAEIVGRLRSVQASKVYLIADGPRSLEEKRVTDDVRCYVEGLIDWECEVVKNFSTENAGVYDRIGRGARWVFEREECAIFLEDDNLPEETFFDFCKAMLSKYRHDTRILWVCGTNYLGSYDAPGHVSYVFTRHLLPCGWASWSQKFLEYYDGDLQLLSDDTLNAVKETYNDMRLFRQDRDVVLKTQTLLRETPTLASWDRQMLFSLRVHGLYGISPAHNQIKNIGADALSTHGGTSMRKTMTSRFCEIPTQRLAFPLQDPKFVLPDPGYEKQVGEIILYPWLTRTMMLIVRFLKPFFGLSRNESLILKLRQLWK